MGERSAYLEGANLALVIVVSLLCLAAGLLFLGPGHSVLEHADDELARKTARERDWQREHAATRPISDEERGAWAARYGRMRSFGAPPGDEAGLMAWVADQLDAPSLRGLEVTRVAAEEESLEPLALSDPFGPGGVQLTPVPIRVRFDASYRDVARILARLEPESSALKVSQLKLTRQLPGVRVDLELELWTREERDA